VTLTVNEFWCRLSCAPFTDSDLIYEGPVQQCVYFRDTVYETFTDILIKYLSAGNDRSIRFYKKTDGPQGLLDSAIIYRRPPGVSPPDGAVPLRGGAFFYIPSECKGKAVHQLIQYIPDSGLLGSAIKNVLSLSTTIEFRSFALSHG
jgi:hypothetical protein